MMVGVVIVRCGVLSNGGGSHSDGCWEIIAVWWMIIVGCRDDCGRW